jgi:hypothetical protein
VRLTIAVPEAQVVEAPVLLRLVGMEPACDVEADEQRGCRTSLALVLRGRWVGVESIIHQADASGRSESIS